MYRRVAAVLAGAAVGVGGGTVAYHVATVDNSPAAQAAVLAAGLVPCDATGEPAPPATVLPLHRPEQQLVSRLVHAGTAPHDTGVCVLSGPSGSGKTTAMQAVVANASRRPLLVLSLDARHGVEVGVPLRVHAAVTRSPAAPWVWRVAPPQPLPLRESLDVVRQALVLAGRSSHSNDGDGVGTDGDTRADASSADSGADGAAVAGGVPGRRTACEPPLLVIDAQGVEVNAVPAVEAPARTAVVVGPGGRVQFVALNGGGDSADAPAAGAAASSPPSAGEALVQWAADVTGADDAHVLLVGRDSSLHVPRGGDGVRVSRVRMSDLDRRQVDALVPFLLRAVHGVRPVSGDVPAAAMDAVWAAVGGRVADVCAVVGRLCEYGRYQLVPVTGDAPSKPDVGGDGVHADDAACHPLVAAAVGAGNEVQSALLPRLLRTMGVAETADVATGAVAVDALPARGEEARVQGGVLYSALLSLGHHKQQAAAEGLAAAAGSAALGPCLPTLANQLMRLWGNEPGVSAAIRQLITREWVELQPFPDNRRRASSPVVPPASGGGSGDTGPSGGAASDAVEVTHADDGDGEELWEFAGVECDGPAYVTVRPALAAVFASRVVDAPPMRVLEAHLDHQHLRLERAVLVADADGVRQEYAQLQADEAELDSRKHLMEEGDVLVAQIELKLRRDNVDMRQHELRRRAALLDDLASGAHTRSLGRC